MDTDAPENSDIANVQLLATYRSAIEEWRMLREENPNLSIPMFLKASPIYFSVRPRIIFVGQETHGWWRDCPIPQEALKAEDVMNFYQDEWINNYRTASQSPYWQTIRRITKGVGLEPFPQAVLTTNLFPCDSKMGRSPEPVLEIMRTWRLLPVELSVLKPDFVVFFIGKIYSYNLEPYFGKKVEPLISSAKPVVSYQPPGQSWSALVTYHPRYLQMADKGEVIEHIIRSIKSFQLTKARCLPVAS